ncbi:MAG: hypothetical protein J5613_01125 [Alphaproteobacteria bacterium]|nr:hypothetical protein [Alphaproteobacteria bacterium]
MANEDTPFKNTYVIDMGKLLTHPFNFMPNGTILPIETKNGEHVTDEVPKLFSERLVKKMINEYPDLSDSIGSLTARTIIEYMDVNGQPVLTLYPTNDTELHTNDWTHIDGRVLPEIQSIIAQRQKLVSRYKLSHPK